MGTSVGTTSHVLHLDPRYFREPRAFMPQRWFAPASELGKGFKHETAAFIPFGMGVSNCLGREIARMEIKMVAAYLVQRFDFAFGPSWNEEEWARKRLEHVIMRRAPVMISLKERKF